MKSLPKEIVIFRSAVIKASRNYFWELGFLEVDTPCLKPIVGMEPYLDPFEVTSPSKKERGFLITSPEYALKQILSTGIDRIFEFSHTFRSGEMGSDFHSKEFLMLELYAKGMDDVQLREFTKGYLIFLIQNFGTSESKTRLQNPKESYIRERTVESIFLEATGSKFDRDSLLALIDLHKLTGAAKEEIQLWPYEDLFFLVFLNLVEPKLGEGIVFLYDYPPECAALARIEGGVAKRFEIYWDGVELANAFYELKDPGEQRHRFEKERELRQKLGKEVFPIDEDFLSCLGEDFPNASGISIGMDRLILKLIAKQRLAEISPYWI
ncbi:MAG: elongation factor P--(R)-beta-lysine ligase [Leptospira sp.]|nr:elongation factor P--(R)-beta-lysine ligase [Leptospira sp.]